jgi:hypothetical protein
MGVVSCLVPFVPGCNRYGVAMSAAVAAATVKAATTMEATTAVHCATAEAAAGRTTAETATNRAASCEATATVEAVTAPAVAAAKTASAPTAVEPWASADEEAAREVARAVVAVRRARVGIIPIVTVGADGSRTNIPRTDSYTHRKALSASVRRKGQGRSKYRKNHEIFHQMFHIWAPSEPVEPF